jgi:uracil-DNA glycosylase
VIATFHPAYILRQTGGAMTEVKRLVWNDLKQVRDRLATPPAVPAPAPDQASLFE